MIRKWYDIFKDNHELVEIRIIDNNSKKTYSGYFTDIESILLSIRKYDDCNIYFTLNSIDHACYSREQRDLIITKPKCTTSDKEILGRDWCLIDIDCEKPADTNSTNQEKELAKEVVNNVYKFLRDEGFNSPIVCDSANGFHLLIKQQMTNSDENTQVMKDFLQVLDMFFSTDKVKVDTSTFNASRICKLYGCVSRKGSDTPERPQRESAILRIPPVITPTENEYFKKVAAMLPKVETPNRSNNYNKDSFNLQEFIEKYGIKIRNKVHTPAFTKYVLEECPFNSSHRAPDSAIFEMANGSYGFKCLHASCSGYTWKDFRLHFDPDAYTKTDFAEFQYKDRFRTFRPLGREDFTPVAESSEKGKKWLSMSDIKFVDLNSIVTIPTGYDLLDKKIMGLMLGDVTVLSGLSGCVDCDTEYFNGYVWKKIVDYTEGEKVLQYNLNGTAELVYPKEYIKKPCDYLYLIETKYGINQCVSDEHRMVYQTSKGNLAIKSFSEMKRMHENSKLGFLGKFYTSFKYNGIGIKLSEFEIRLMCAVICDGTFTSKYHNKNICRFNIKKERKKERLEWILSKLELEYRKEQYNPKDTDFSNYIVSVPRIEKHFTPFWYDCSNEQLEIICDEILYWDGHQTPKRKTFSSTIKENADFIQFAFTACGYRAVINVNNRVGCKYKTNGKEYVRKSIEYEVNITNRNMVGLDLGENKTPIKKYHTKDGFKYCFSVPSSMLVLRRNNRINITGNTGKTSWIDCLALNVINCGYKVAIWSGELQDFRFQGWIDQIAAGKNFVCKKEGYDNFYYAPRNICDKINRWLDGKLYLYNNNYNNRWIQLFSDIKVLVEEQNVQLVVLDNLMSLQIDDYEGDKYSKQTAFINELKEYAKKKNIHVILVAHPRKEGGFLRKESISGTADLTNLADNVVILHRVNKDFETRAGEFWGKDKVIDYLKYSTVIELCKNRSLGVVDLIVGMYYEPESRRLKNTISEHMIYGWQEEAKPMEAVIEEDQSFNGYQRDYIDSDMPFGNPTDEVPF